MRSSTSELSRAELGSLATGSAARSRGKVRRWCVRVSGSMCTRGLLPAVRSLSQSGRTSPIRELWPMRGQARRTDVEAPGQTRRARDSANQPTLPSWLRIPHPPHQPDRPRDLHRQDTGPILCGAAVCGRARLHAGLRGPFVGTTTSCGQPHRTRRAGGGSGLGVCMASYRTRSLNSAVDTGRRSDASTDRPNARGSPAGARSRLRDSRIR